MVKTGDFIEIEEGVVLVTGIYPSDDGRWMILYRGKKGTGTLLESNIDFRIINNCS